MAAYRVVIRKSVLKDMRSIPVKDSRRIVAAIRGLASDPRPPGVRKLADDKYRLRAGVYRILYQIRDQELVVTVVRVAHRKDAYRS